MQRPPTCGCAQDLVLAQGKRRARTAWRRRPVAPWPMPRRAWQLLASPIRVAGRAPASHPVHDAALREAFIGRTGLSP